MLIIKHINLIRSTGINRKTEHQKPLYRIIEPPDSLRSSHENLDSHVFTRRIVPVWLNLLGNLFWLSASKDHHSLFGRPRYPIFCSGCRGIVCLRMSQSESRESSAVRRDFAYLPSRGLRGNAAIRLVKSPRRRSREQKQRVPENSHVHQPAGIVS